MRKPKVLVIDDNLAMLETMKEYLSDHGFLVKTASDGEGALRQFEEAGCDAVLTDLRMKGFDGLDVLGEIRKRDMHVPVVIMTAFGNVESAVEAIQLGAYHYLTKPFEMATLRMLLQRAVREGLMREENAHVSLHGLVGQSQMMRDLRTLIGRVASAPSPVLIFGETGAGKETVARAIHLQSPRWGGPFVAVNCSALPEMLLDGELFGHARGAVPGTTHLRRGLMVEAEGGTLFLDEVADMPLGLQAKLLRVLKTGELRGVGSEGSHQVQVPVQVNFRCVAATHQNLQDLVNAGKFREDLYFRLNVLTVRIPPLRDRREDIVVLTRHFLETHRARAARETMFTLTPAALRVLETHPWPGNVRELENLIERLVVTSSGATVDADLLRSELTPILPGDPVQSLAQAKLPLELLERRYIEAVLLQTQGNKSKAAAILGIDLSTLYRRREKHQ